jgi:ankyrin repeat protein
MNPNTTNADGLTALHLAAIENNLEMAQLLISRHANMIATDLRGLTPLHQAALTGADKVAALLLGNGADVTKKDKDGRSTWP